MYYLFLFLIFGEYYRPSHQRLLLVSILKRIVHLFSLILCYKFLIFIIVIHLSMTKLLQYFHNHFIVIQKVFWNSPWILSLILFKRYTLPSFKFPIFTLSDYPISIMFESFISPWLSTVSLCIQLVFSLGNDVTCYSVIISRLTSLTASVSYTLLPFYQHL